MRAVPPLAVTVAEPSALPLLVGIRYIVYVYCYLGCALHHHRRISFHAAVRVGYRHVVVARRSSSRSSTSGRCPSCSYTALYRQLPSARCAVGFAVAAGITAHHWLAAVGLVAPTMLAVAHSRWRPSLSPCMVTPALRVVAVAAVLPLLPGSCTVWCRPWRSP